ncbi:MAG: DNA/RNA non-specific endonuclease [Clostridiales bacterium]|nr:DNA/RNA non-specific endonuclease [Clostridiales bacterium]
MRHSFIAAVLAAAMIAAGCGTATSTGNMTAQAATMQSAESTTSSTITSWNGQDAIPEYSGSAWTAVNGNTPYFTDSDKARTDAFETYSDLDSLGRCGTAYANVCLELMPTEERGAIGQVKPTGWHTVKYPELISDLYLYNRCHLIGFQLAGENANEKNLVTGTRYMNIDGMLSFENMIDDYVEETSNHVLYRVTPIFEGNDLVCRGVEMEAWSVEDQGDGICFHVFAYNVQPGITIDYATGDSHVSDGTEAAVSSEAATEAETSAGTVSANTQEYILNINTGKFHLPECSSVKSMSEKNKKSWTCTRDELIEDGYSPCKICNP